MDSPCSTESGQTRPLMKLSISAYCILLYYQKVFYCNVQNLLNAVLGCYLQNAKRLMQAEEEMPDWTIEGIINIMFFGKAKGNYAICSLRL